MYSSLVALMLIILETAKCPVCDTYFVPLKHLCVLKDGKVYCKQACSDTVVEVEHITTVEPPAAAVEELGSGVQP